MNENDDDHYENSLREDLNKEYEDWLSEHPKPGDDYRECGCGKTDWCNKDTCG